MKNFFKLPKINDCGGVITLPNGKPARWFVYYSYINPQTGKFQRFQVYADMDQYKKKSERNKAALLLQQSVHELLKSGWSPFQEVDIHTKAQVGIEISLREAMEQAIEVKKIQDL